MLDLARLVAIRPGTAYSSAQADLQLRPVGRPEKFYSVIPQEDHFYLTAWPLLPLDTYIN